MNTLQAPVAADRHRQAIIDALKLLKDNPYMRPLVKDEHLAAKGIRYISVRHYMLFYSINEAEKTINLIAFMYSGRNWQKILNTEPQ
jgi:plasmid stabilization system protein ParE